MKRGAKLLRRLSSNRVDVQVKFSPGNFAYLLLNDRYRKVMLPVVYYGKAKLKILLVG